jgi:NAD(P)-dependent dehydrogenase (short-subunit alcohol dehydrogenase family)
MPVPTRRLSEQLVTMTIHKVAIITGASRGVGAALVAGYRGRDWAVVASARTIRPSEEPDLLTVAGDIAEPATAGRIVDAALERFGLDQLAERVALMTPVPQPRRAATPRGILDHRPGTTPEA